MDPKEALRKIRLLSAKVLAGTADDSDVDELAETWDGLDSWMTRGGYSPWATFPYAEGRGPARKL